MHRLHLLRHAKAERDAPGDDKARRLSQRGRDDARRVGAALPAAIGPLDLVLCSTASRTRETAELVLAGFPASLRIEFEDELYLANDTALLRRLRRLTGGSAVLVVGHNPGLHELAINLADPASPSFKAMASGKFPTLARASFALDRAWEGLGRSTHPLIGYATPKTLGRSE